MLPVTEKRQHLKCQAHLTLALDAAIVSSKPIARSLTIKSPLFSVKMFEI